MGLTPPFSESQQQFLSIMPKLTALPSIVASFYIVQHVLRSKTRRSRPYHRLLLAMSSMDFIYSIKSFLSTWIIPKSVPGWGNLGSEASCTAWGLLGQGSAFSSALYNGTLTVYFLLAISYGWKLDRVKRRCELWLHVVPLALGWGTAIAVLLMDLYSAIGWTCWIGGSPVETVNILRWAFFRAELWATFCFMVVALFLMYKSIRAKEMASSSYRLSAVRSSHLSSTHSSCCSSSCISSSMHSVQSTQPQQQQVIRTVSWSKRFATQSWLYILAFSLAWIFPMIQWVISQSGGKLYYPILAITVIINPLQGFFNALIYIRPRFIEYYNRKRQERIMQKKEIVEQEGKRQQQQRSIILWQAMAHACHVQDEPEDEEDEEPPCEEKHVSSRVEDDRNDDELAEVQETDEV